VVSALSSLRLPRSALIRTYLALLPKTRLFGRFKVNFRKAGYTDKWMTSGSSVILPQLHETIFADLLQALIRSSNQDQSTLHVSPAIS
jgi:hypothetical protein